MKRRNCSKMYQINFASFRIRWSCGKPDLTRPPEPKQHQTRPKKAKPDQAHLPLRHPLATKSLESAANPLHWRRDLGVEPRNIVELWLDLMLIQLCCQLDQNINPYTYFKTIQEHICRYTPTWSLLPHWLYSLHPN